MTVKRTIEQKVLSYLRKEVIPTITYNNFDRNYYKNGEKYDVYKLAHVILEKIGTISVSSLSNMLRQEVNTEFNGLTDYLNKCYLEYGQNDSINYLIREILGCETDIESKYIRKFFIGAVARAFEPGCDLQTMLILYTSKGGYNKTRFFRKLVDPTLQTDADFKINITELKKQCSNFWIVLFDEMDDNITPNKLSSFKRFITETNDSWREYYTTDSQIFKPRNYICCGTTNKKEFLIDTTEERRFWIMNLRKKIDIDWVIENRDKVWAQANYLYKSGEQWWLTEDEQEISNRHVANFKKTNAYDDEIVETALMFEEPFTLKMLSEQLKVPDVGYQKFANHAKNILMARTELKYQTKPSRHNGAMGRWWKKNNK